MASLATPAQLGLFINQTPLAADDGAALLILSIASGMVRDYLNVDSETGLEAVAGDIATFDPVNGVVFLDELPVTAVTLVETFDGAAWTTADPATYTVGKRLGIIGGRPGTGVSWPYLPGSWRVTYSHGFAVIPMSIVGAVLGVAARAYTKPDGIDSEKIGGYQVKYSMEADGFSPIETKALARYVNPRIA